MRRMLSFSSNKCCGCMLCEKMCSFRHTGKFSRTGSSIRIISNTKLMIHTADFCRHCKKPVCVGLCPVNAITRDEQKGMVNISAEKCIGCGRCIECPLGGIHIDGQSGLAVNCDHCGGNPACVPCCPTGGLQYMQVGEPHKV